MSDARTLRAFRWHLLLTAGLASAGFAVVAAAVLFVPLFAQLDREGAPPEMVAGVAGYVLELHATFWPVILGSLMATVVGGTLLFERMRAPLVRFVHVFDRVSAGQTPRPIRIRRSDYLRHEAEALNAMIAKLAERDARLEQELARVEAALEEVEPGDADAKVAAACDEVRRALQAIRDPDRSGG